MRNGNKEVERIKDKIKQIQKYLEELETTFPVSFEEYLRDFKVKAIWERYFEKIVEAIIDLVFLVIREKGFKIPDDDESSFNILREEGIISEVLAEKLKDAKGMRNIIAHEYGKIDDKLVHHSITEEFLGDVEELISLINSFLNSNNIK